jgi:UDP-N-acetylmuramyl pentapeptide phosphotransferase/UDP-N-acetylglucosamine-1-phosphate transferase
MIRYFPALLLSLLGVAALIPLFMKLAIRLDFVDKPVPDNERKVHREPIPMLAGIPMYLVFMAAWFMLGDHSNKKLMSVAIGGLLILGIGTVDDWYKTHRREFPALPKFLVQISAAALAYFGGIVFTGFENPFTGDYVWLPGILQFLLTVVWIFGVTTVINFTDGLDGLAGGLSAISGGTLFIVAFVMNQHASALMAILLVGTTLGYLRFNRHPAKVFMGDAGATFLGYILGIIAIDGAFKSATLLSLLIPLLALGVPIFDNLYVVIRRFREGKPVYQADALQIHYRLKGQGMNTPQAVRFIWLANLCSCMAAIILLLLQVR